MTAYQETIYERKQMAVGAKKRKCGMKSKKCGLPSDRMSKKELEKMNGEVKCYNVLAPWTWQEFKEAPDDICREYIDRLATVYEINYNLLSKMFGVTSNSIRAQFSKKGIKFSCKTGQTTIEVRTKFEKFLSCAMGGELKKTSQDASETDFNGGTTNETETCRVTQENHGNAAMARISALNGLSVSASSISLCGICNREEIAKVLDALLPKDGTECCIKIEVSNKERQ